MLSIHTPNVKLHTLQVNFFWKWVACWKKKSPKKVNPHAHGIIETPDVFILKS